MTARDVDLLAHRLDSLTRSATRIRRHLADLHSLAWDKPVTDRVAVQETKTDHTPRAGDPRARHLWERIAIEAGRAEDLFVGLERDVTAHFFAHSTSPEPSRGSLISAAEHAQLLARQRTRPDTPARLIDQPAHPSKKR